MTKKILAALALGVISGLFIIPQKIYAHTGLMMDIGLCLLLFFVGIDLGSNKEIFSSLKKVGFKVLMIPVATIAGSLFGGIICSIIFKMDLFGSLAVASGMSWYTLSAIIITPVSAELGTVAFLTNVFREILAFIFIPTIAKRIGYLETIAAGAAISMDTGLPIITKNTSQELAVISFISGVIISLSVTVLVPIFVGLI
ncbi:lysine exporter LysO family protein [Sedimentibacter hydroxybenzoicus DSM 7310]|uniref:Lysine exporter LysO family protein n=1 Tax=Sedimentibacter hydroxybenzoicus DSM 7310 TaxID=1123245 RepID=A0A974BLJ9_SEDHY|nr:lysine exporter LysO family protein [Sedimentibacter hydroxybenzoicus]NYB75071.1 lysine exporter LysO family protein [Sedimentibacter hydroxybenzoicus DSM 7310]